MQSIIGKYAIQEKLRQILIRILLGGEYVKFTGVVRVRELPRGIERADFMEWWPRADERERERYTVYEHQNILTSIGRTQLLTYIASNSAVTQGFAEFFSVGTFPITSVSSGDTGVQSEIFRAVPNNIVIAGQQVDISTFFGASQANGNYTNAGLYGGSATGILGSGTLYTHTLYQYNKQNGQAITNDYLIQLT
jgi:hypothetical protein